MKNIIFHLILLIFFDLITFSSKIILLMESFLKVRVRVSFIMLKWMLILVLSISKNLEEEYGGI